MIRVNDGIVIDFTDWSEFKKWLNGTFSSLRFVYSDDGESYEIIAIDDRVYRRLSINKSDASEFETIYKPKANTSLQPRTSDGRVRTATSKPDSSSVTIYSHDWTDRTTWYSESARIVDEIATDSGDHLVYTLAHGSVIDTYHGLFTGEDYLKDASGNSYRAVVKVDDAVKVEQDPHYATGGDYTINYATGAITFLSAQNPAHEVKVTYNHAVTSGFIVKPAIGKKLIIDVAEVQFSDDVVPTDTVIFQPQGYAGVFAPQLGLPPTTLLPLGDPVKYKSMSDYQNDALRAYPMYQPIGGSGWRGMPKGVAIYDWDYLREKTLYSSYGMQIHISLEHDEPFGGYYGTATFYCGTENE